MHHNKNILLNELQEVLSLARLYMLEELPNEKAIVSGKETFDYFAKTARSLKNKQAESHKKTENQIPHKDAPIKQPLHNSAQLAKPTHKEKQESYQVIPSSSAQSQEKVPQQKASQESTILSAEKEPEPKETSRKNVTPQEPPKKLTANLFAVPYLLALPHPFHYASNYSLDEIKEKAIKLFPQLKLVNEPLTDKEAQAIASSWKKENSISDCALISLAEPGSQEEIFLKQVVEAVHTRIQKCTLYPAHLETIAKVVTLTRHEVITTIILATTHQTKKLGQEWLLELEPFGFIRDENSYHESKIPLHMIGKLSGAKVFALDMPDAPATHTAFKQALWKELKSTLQRDKATG